MESLFVLMVVLSLLAGTGALMWLVPFGRWRFSHEGRQYEVVNYGLRETVSVDGTLVASTRVAGDHTTWATHAIALPDGRTLEVKVFTDNLVTIRCLARIGDEVLFDSESHAGEWVATATLPDTTPQRASSTAPQTRPDDPRWDAAQVLLDELTSGDPEVAAAAERLRLALFDAFGALAQAQRAADAHQALGGGGEDFARVLEQREETVAHALSVLRELHVAVATRPAQAAELPALTALLGQLEAEREVDTWDRKRDAAQRARARDRNLS